MAIPVVQLGTGNVGVHALKALITNPKFELTGVWVSSDAKAGKDAAELAGLKDSTGVLASTDLDAVLATGPQCAVYNAMADNRLPEALEDYRRVLAAGINIVGSGPVFLQYPWQVIPEELISPLEDAARKGNSSLYVNGIDPGFANDLLPLALAGTCQNIQQIRCMEIVDYATYDSAVVMFDVMGFGKPLDEIPMLLQTGVLSLAWGSVVRQLAAGLGISLDEVAEVYVREPAPEDFDIASGHIPKGTRRGAAVRGVRNGQRRPRRRPGTCHPVARGSVPRLAAARPARRLLPHRDHRRTVVRHGHLPEQPPRRSQSRRTGRHRDAGRQRDPCGGGRPAGHRDDPRPAPGPRAGALRSGLISSTA